MCQSFLEMMDGQESFTVYHPALFIYSIFEQDNEGDFI